ncbi:hypothetical protein [Paraburkholderia sp. DHOC27]|uniref:hypothetical protein n=1 Tax=Paraburkholderia sp. DHOC27 TaxID=2303330 RepID=UPI000E3E80B9|nr:hypothetical protein [Paraburkholderia sp. DHOC27]RFU47464.1 hypothetical protein D0B32_15250 [Paraburkholderia sp. DHOC27]
MKNDIYQIFYSDETRRMVAPDFIPLDNSGQRPDWREYWPMRRFFLENTLDPEARYGFFSPKFTLKTRLTSAQAREFVDSTPDDVDVITFSPFFDQAAFFDNVFHHAAACHPGIEHAINGALRLIAPDLDMTATFMSSVQTVFCNYLIAKPAFWQEWLQKCEVIFNAAEARDTELALRLNAEVKYEQQRAPAKVFVIERIPSLILGTQRQWKVRNFNPMTLPIASEPLSRFGADLVALDALKFAANATGFPQYVTAYLQLRSAVNEKLKTLPRSA